LRAVADAHHGAVGEATASLFHRLRSAAPAISPRKP